MLKNITHKNSQFGVYSDDPCLSNKKNLGMQQKHKVVCVKGTKNIQVTKVYKKVRVSGFTCLCS